MPDGFAGVVVRSRLLARPGAGEVEHPDAVVPHKSGELERRVHGHEAAGVERLEGLPMLHAVLHGEARAAFQGAEVEDRRAVALHYVLAGALLVAGAGQLEQRVVLGYPPVLGDAVVGRPAAAGEARVERGVERSAIHAGLATRD